MPILTKKQNIVLQSIKDYYSSYKIMPTVKEIQEGCRNFGLILKSSRSVFLYLNVLEEKGIIRRSFKERGIQLLDHQDDKNLVDIPIFGTANAGSPTFFAEQNTDGFLKISKDIVKHENLYAIKVEGSSMDRSSINGKKINSGDYIIINPKDEDYRNNDKVLVTIDGLATVKKLKIIDDNNYGLFPESSDPIHKPIYITKDHNSIINGKVVDVFPSSDQFINEGDEFIYEEIND